MKNTYFFYKKKKLSESEILLGCLAIVDKDGVIDSFKFKFGVFEDMDLIIKTWPWYFVSNGTHTFKIDELPDHIRYIITENFLTEFNEELEILSKERLIPEYVNRDTLFFRSLINEDGDTFNELEISIAKTLTLWRIASFFMENIEYVFEFPLYNEYVKETGTDITVEEFLEQILFATSKSLS
jgi:hypothetical protein